MKYMQTKIETKILEELQKTKKVQRELLNVQITADKIGYATQFALEDNEKTARSAYFSGYELGVKDGYIECLQRMLVMFGEE